MEHSNVIFVVISVSVFFLHLVIQRAAPALARFFARRSEPGRAEVFTTSAALRA